MHPDASTLALLESAYKDFHTSHLIERDAILHVYRYSKPEDREVVAFLSALISYGNVRTIQASIDSLLKHLGDCPFVCIRDRAWHSDIAEFYHRFTNADDMEVILHWTSEAIRSHGSLERFFANGQSVQHLPMTDLLSDFVGRFTAQTLPAEWEPFRQSRERSLKYLLSDPRRGSACKRLNMFLRWMVRPNDGIDLGLWTSLHTRQLMLPVDTHLLKVLRELGWIRAQTANWKVVEEATQCLRLYSPEDPIKYDFALCHLSMVGLTVQKYAEDGCGVGTTTPTQKRREKRTTKRDRSTSSRR